MHHAMTPRYLSHAIALVLRYGRVDSAGTVAMNQWLRWGV